MISEMFSSIIDSVIYFNVLSSYPDKQSNFSKVCVFLLEDIKIFSLRARFERKASIAIFN